MTAIEAGGWCLGGVVVVFLILLVYILIRGATIQYDDHHEQHFDNIRFHPDQWVNIPPERSSRWSLFRK